MILRPFLLRRTLPTRLSSIQTQITQLRHPFSLRNRPLLLTSAALGFSIPFFASPRFPALLDTSSPVSFSSSSYTHSPDAKTPLNKDSKSINPAAVKQISLGSILGLGAGVLVSAFSRTLTLLLGVGIVVVQVRFGGLHILSRLAEAS